MWKLVKIKEIKRGRNREARNALVEMSHERFLNRLNILLHPLEINNENSRIHHQRKSDY